MLLGAALAVAVVGAAVADGRVADDGILNQTVAQDGVGDSGGSPDLSTLTVTTYADGTISFAVAFANRSFLHLGETVQIFVDLNDDGKEDLNLSIWPNGTPSYLDRWTGSDWADVRQLPELVQTEGQFSVRLSLQELRSAAGVDYGTTIGAVVGAWTTDPATQELRTEADDWLPDSRSWIQHQIQKPQPPPPPTTTAPSPTPPPIRPASPKLAVVCVKHTLRATVKVAKGSKVLSVFFYANGKLRLKDRKAPYVARIPTRGLRTPITIRAVVHQKGASKTVHRRAKRC